MTSADALRSQAARNGWKVQLVYRRGEQEWWSARRGFTAMYDSSESRLLERVNLRTNSDEFDSPKPRGDRRPRPQADTDSGCE